MRAGVLCTLVVLLVLGFTAADDSPFANRTAINNMCAHNRCHSCISTKGCGWCTKSWTCMYGNETGPVAVSNGTTPLPCVNDTKVWFYSPTQDPTGICSVEQGTAIADPQSTPKLPLQYDVVCKNGGQRHWGPSNPATPPVIPMGSSFCDCPDGWGGIDCSTCTKASVCQVPGVPGNFTCERGLFPQSGPLFLSQKMSCSCQGPTSTEICNFMANGLLGSMRIAMDFSRVDSFINVSVITSVTRPVPNPLYSGVSFVANASSCVVEQDIGKCPQGTQYQWNDNGEPCARVTCSVGGGYNPFPPYDGAPPCPNPPPSGNTAPCYPSSYGTCRKCISRKCWDKSWRYRYCTDVVDAISAITFICQYSATNDGVYRCAFGTPGFGPLALSCTTGQCQYNAPPPTPPPPIPPPPAISPEEWNIIILSVPAFLTIVLGTACGCVLCGRRRELRQLEAAMVKMMLADSAAQSGKAKPTSGPQDAPSVDAPLLPSNPRSSMNAGGEGRPRWRPGPIPETVLTFRDLTYTIKKNVFSTRGRPRQVLRGVSAHIPSSMFAVLGPSGAGKSTMLDIIAGRKSTAGGSWSGRVAINGVVLKPEELRQCVGYVTQDDVALGTQSVREYLLWQTRMRLPQSLTRKQRHERVNHLLAEMDLTRVASSKIGDAFVRGLSGGEKRRLSIAAELITDPAVLVTDEPTSGLDSANAKGVVDALVRVARAGRVVIMSIHQPRSYIWGQFDSLLLLGKGGEVVYNGRRERCIDHFAELGYPAPTDYNPADFLLDMVAGLDPIEAARLENAGKARRRALSLPMPKVPGDGAEEGKVDADHHRGSRQSAEMSQLTHATDYRDDILQTPTSADREAVLRKYRRHRAGFLRSFWELSIRTFTNVIRNPYLLALNYIATFVVSFLTGLVFHHLPFTFDGLQDRLGIFFFSFLFFGMTSLSSLGIWREERLLFLRERASNTYTTGPYFLAKVLCDILPLRVLPPIIYSAMVYWHAGLHDDPYNFFIFVAIVTLVNVTSATLCLAIGALVRNLSLANLVASLCLLYSLLLCGLLSHNAETSSAMGIFQKASYMNFAFEILGNNEFVGQTYNLSPNLPNHKLVPPFPATGETVVLTLGLRLNEFQEDIIALCAYLVFFTSCVYFILKFLVKEER